MGKDQKGGNLSYLGKEDLHDGWSVLPWYYQKVMGLLVVDEDVQWGASKEGFQRLSVNSFHVVDGFVEG